MISIYNAVKKHLKELYLPRCCPIIIQNWIFLFNPIEDGERQKGCPTDFYPATSTNVGISPKNFLTFIFNPFLTLAYNFKAIPNQ